MPWWTFFCTQTFLRILSAIYLEAQSWILLVSTFCQIFENVDHGRGHIEIVILSWKPRNEPLRWIDNWGHIYSYRTSAVFESDCFVSDSGDWLLASSGRFQPSSGVSTPSNSLLHPLVGGSVVMTSPYSLLASPQVCSSLLLHNQHDALSAASPSLLTPVLLVLPFIPNLCNNLHADWAGKPLAPTSTGNNHALQFFTLHTLTWLTETLLWLLIKRVHIWH